MLLIKLFLLATARLETCDVIQNVDHYKPCKFKTRLKSISYHFRKIWNSDQLSEQFYQPQGTQDDCATVLDNYPQVMIEIHHGGKLLLIIDEALRLGMGP